MRVSIGPVAEIPEDRCVAVGSEDVVAFRIGDEVRAFSSRCLHQDASLAGGWIRDGVLSCPLHFWRYSIEDGRLVGSAAGAPALACYPASVVDGEGFVEVPDPVPVRSFRELQLEHAKNWREEQGPS